MDILDLLNQENPIEDTRKLFKEMKTEELQDLLRQIRHNRTSEDVVVKVKKERKAKATDDAMAQLLKLCGGDIKKLEALLS